MSSSSRPANGSQPSGSTTTAAPRPLNPQLGSEPWFAYPTPTPEDLRSELPPYLEDVENVRLGLVLDRLVRKSYGDLRVLLQQTLPATLETHHKPKQIINYAKQTRQAVLKYLAIIRWKNAVDIHISGGPPISHQNNGPAASFPTPQTNGESNDTSPAGVGYVGKGKGRMVDDEPKVNVARGKVTDAKRITHFMEHQNRQHELAIEHLRHTTKGIESLRFRNADLLTAISLLTLGTYPRLPTNLTEPFTPRKPLTNASVLRTLRQLDSHILYRLRCIEYLPPELEVYRIADGRAYVRGGGPGGWKAELTVVGFDDGEDSRWWLTGVEWGWKLKKRGTDDPGGTTGKRFEGEQLQGILDVANVDVLPPRPVQTEVNVVVTDTDAGGKETPGQGTVRTIAERRKRLVDAPLVRIYNFLQQLSLSYQLEMLFSEALALSQGRWRGQLLVQMDRDKKELKLKYWIRPRPPPVQQQTQAAVGKRPAPPVASSSSRTPLTGGTLTVSLSEATEPLSDRGSLTAEISADGRISSERILRLGIVVKWEVGEAGVGGGLKTGDALDSSELKIDSNALSIENILNLASRTHASLLTRHHTAALLAAPRIALFPADPPQLVETDNTTRPLALRIPLPSRQRQAHLLIGVSSLTGLIEIEDSGSTDSSATSPEDRGGRAKLATVSANERGRLMEDVGRLLVAVITENLEAQFRQLGCHPARRIPLRSQDMAKNELHPASTVFVPLPTSELHHLTARVAGQGVAFELVKLVRSPSEAGLGMKLAIGDRSPVDLVRLRARRKDRKGANPGKRAREADQLVVETSVNNVSPPDWQIDDRDLRDVFIFANALVAQTIVEQQLKDRSIPYSLHYPPASGSGSPRSSSAVAGMVPTLLVDAGDLLKDGRAADVAMPRVYMQIREWWKGDKCSVVTVIHLQHKPALSSSGASPATSAPLSTAAMSEGITFDQTSSIVRFSAPDISRCVPSLLEQWERLCKVIVVAGEVNKLNKADAFKGLRMLSFDLRTATMMYSPGFCASITYNPSSDSYEVSFFRSGFSSGTTPGIQAIATPAISIDGTADASPHQFIAPLLGNRLNEMTVQGRRGSVAREWIALLRWTLPFLLEVESIRSASSTAEFPALVVRGVSEFKLIWDVEGVRRYGLDWKLVRNGRWIVKDACLSDDQSCGIITPIPGWKERVVEDAFQRLKSTDRDKDKTDGQGSGDGTTTTTGTSVLAVKVDGGAGLMCDGKIVGDIVRGVCADVENILGMS
ncbi:hypothetical protein BCR39DRAFT_589263 [Naematelia encephala]|uniref:Mediator of RNA polymerase II transcription subunit 14 n=1 Tax=Naematelia encephala TaxID=71784 RepID=A0A1Y2AY44_9TREE|nr:hypothetical protein BCR39DRAFT_589263 [Naematelia encephala]